MQNQKRQLNPRAVWLLFASYIIRLICILIVFAGALLIIDIEDDNLNLMQYLMQYKNFLLNYRALSIFVVFLAILYLWAYLSRPRFYYMVTDGSFKMGYGIIYKKNIDIPYNKIQIVYIVRGVIARIFGLSSIYIETAGSVGSDSVTEIGNLGRGKVRLPGVFSQEAEKLRNELIARAQNFKKQA